MQANELVVSSNARDRGFTLIEMLMTIVIVAIALSIGVPSMSKQIEKSRQNAMRSDLQQSIRLAGAQALASSRPVVLCPGDGTCAADSSGWRDGFILFVDSNGNGSYDNGTDRLLRQYTNSSERKISISNRPTSSPTADKFYFLPNGASSGGTINICSESEKGIDQRLVVSGFGSAELQKDQTDACGNS